jgi:hypothetical protein
LIEQIEFDLYQFVDEIFSDSFLEKVPKNYFCLKLEVFILILGIFFEKNNKF